jgi:ComF family protein
MALDARELWKQSGAAGHALARGLFQLVYPNLCWVCGQPVPYDQPSFCDACRGALLTEPLPSCPRCAATVGPFTNLEGGCSHCRDQSFAFDGVVRLGRYDGVLREVVLRMKNLEGDGLAEAVGDLWAKHAEAELAALGADRIVPVPLHWWRRWTRGYNQSEALAGALSARLRIHCETGWLRRIRPTPFQHHLSSATAKRDNVKGAFAVRRGVSLKGLTILLVDDVMTTASTANEAARPLRAAGAARIVVAVLARASP